MTFRLKIDKERCKGCVLCVAACTRAVLRIASDLNKRGMHYAEATDSEACTGCKQCAQMCPEAAIEIVKEDPEQPAGEAKE